MIRPLPARGRPRSAKRGGGFTLIEVVVAFVLLTLVLATAFEIFSGGLRRAGELENYSRALVIAQSRLALAGQEEPYQEGEVRGESEDGRFRWAVGTMMLEEGIGDPATALGNTHRLFRVEARVEWSGADTRTRSLSLATLGLGQRQP